MALVSGTVRDVGGDPLEAARVYFASGPAPLPDVAALTGEDGSFTLSAPAPGTYEVECAAEGRGTQREAVEVVEGEETRLDFRLGPVD
jgi:Carboxypeptidase regulatory-like domain